VRNSLAIARKAQNVVQAQGSIAVLAKKTHKSRTSLYKSLAEDGNPYLKSANELLTAKAR